MEKFINSPGDVGPEDLPMRYPAVAGQFYAGDRESLMEQIDRCFLHPLGPGRVPEVPGDPDRGPRRIKGVVVPHAGYMYSGPVAAHSYHADPTTRGSARASP